ncbi:MULTISPECIES: hypothetical protein [Terrabacteria group]|uniref:SGNH/GDSL hydrolase family protein n=1 Tax=Bacillati TaxID=1783272 RepID=UPI001C6EE564|nr:MULTISPECIES: hypothetical protein [Terrabacteria group]MBW9212554.1 hypothetical protein [Trueperella sp. zg.1013]
MKKPNKEQVKFTVWLMVMVVLMVGVFAVFTATNKKEEDAKTLKNNLNQQEEALKEKKATVETQDGKVHASQAYSDLSAKGQADLKSITFIGDSVMLGSSATLQSTFPDATIDAKESRQIWDATKIFKALERRGTLGKTVVIGLGTNSPFSLDLGQKVVDSLGKNRKIYWINVHGPMNWTDKSNASIQAVVDKNSHVKLIDWHSYAKNHKEWFYVDGIHLKPQGAKEYANFILKSLS